jgi:NAD(P)-dependent dehydrogenase (short-subunit alcohol dehydrogenase family)
MKDKVVFVTGAARGIGAAVSKELAARGARIALTGLEVDELAARAAELGPRHVYREVDVTDPQALQAAVDATVDQLGGIDIVVANAGIGTYGTVDNGDPRAWLHTIDVNLNGVFRTVHATLPHILERRGYVLAIASVASFLALPGMSSYCASKAAVEALVRSLRAEVGFRGVDVGSAHPSWIDTDLVREASQDLESFRFMRSKLPWPLKATTSLQDCAKAIADGIEGRKARIYVPQSVALIFWLRGLLNTSAGERMTAEIVKEAVPMMDKEVAALGRSGSVRTIRINRLAESEVQSDKVPQSKAESSTDESKDLGIEAKG